MQKQLLLALFLLTGTSLSAMARPSVDVQVGSDDYYGWQGPGWYYGHYFSNQDDYIAWMEGTGPYYGTYQTSIWIGPGWYGGYWYWNENDWHDHHHNHSYDHNGDGGHHGDGGGDHGGGDHGGGDHGGGGGHHGGGGGGGHHGGGGGHR